MQTLRLTQSSLGADRYRVEIALGVTKAIAGRNRNVPVREFFMSLDFSQIATGARLAEGSYVAVQIPESLKTVRSWDDWVYHPANGQIVNRDDPATLVQYNYLVFGITRYEGA
jgi:hypothetical protein